jgi:hypothetical protein
LNGCFDFIWPPSLLGTPKERKRRVLYGTGHDIPCPEMTRQVFGPGEPDLRENKETTEAVP